MKKEEQDREVLLDFIFYQIFNGGCSGDVKKTIERMDTPQLKVLCSACTCAISNTMSQLMEAKIEMREGFTDLFTFLNLSDSKRMILNMKFLKEFKERRQ